VFCLAKKQLPNAALGDPVPLRVVLYFWAVKARSLLFSYGVKEVRECSNKVSKALSMVLTTVDLTSGFWQQMLEEKSRHLHGLLRAGQGGQVPVEGDSDGVAGLAGVVCRPDELCPEWSIGHHYVH
jgi:hypothetical protein